MPLLLLLHIFFFIKIIFVMIIIAGAEMRIRIFEGAEENKEQE